MTLEIVSLSQRIALLKTHLKELKELRQREKIEQNKLIHHYKHVSAAASSPATKADLYRVHLRNLRTLSSHFKQAEKQLLERQQRAEMTQNRQITLQRNQPSATL